jgi:hypothetical protein
VQALANNNDKYTVVLKAPGATTVTTAQATLAVAPDTIPPVLLTAGTVKHGTAIEIGLGFDEALDAASANTAANYTLSKGTVTSARYEPYATPINGAAPVVVKGDVVLVTSGLVAGDAVTVTVKNVKDVKGNAMSATGSSQATTVTSKMTWVDVGGNDYQDGDSTVPQAFADNNLDASKFYDNAVALTTDKDFDLISGGSGNWNNYDEMTFVYEEITGDFDRVVRVEYQDPSSQWARAGISARTALDQGVKHADVVNTPMGATIIVRVNPVTQYNGNAANNAYEFVYRDTIGGNYANSGGGSVPAYPNAWMRLKRTGQVIDAFRSVDGVNWVNIGNRDYSAIAIDPVNAPETFGFPDKMYVGPSFAPELNNNDFAFLIGHSVVAKFRDYGPIDTGTPNIGAVTLAGGNVTITWTGGGTLEWTSALQPGATWTSTNDSDGSYSEATTTAQMKFFRVRK